MRWKLPWPKLAGAGSSSPASDEQPDSWQRHVEALRQAGIPEPGSAVHGRKPATVADEQALYDVAPSFVELLPWVEFLPGSKSMLLEDGQSVAAFYELVPLAPKAGNPAGSRMPATPWKTRFRTVSMNWTRTRGCSSSMPRTNRASTSTCRPCAITCSHARGSAFTEFYLRFFGHHLRAVAKPGGLFEDTVVTRLLARADAACAHGGVPPRERTGTGKPPRPDTRADAGHRLRPPMRRPGERRHPGPAHGCSGRSRLAAAMVQPAPHAARPWGGGPGALLRVGALSGQYRGKRGRRDRVGERAGFQPAAVLWAAALGRGARPGTSTACRTAC